VLQINKLELHVPSVNVQKTFAVVTSQRVLLKSTSVKSSVFD